MQEPNYFYENVHVVRVIDGDTLEVVIDFGMNVLHKTTIRLRGYNAPEMTGEHKYHGIRSRDMLLDIVEHWSGVALMQTWKDKKHLDKRDKYGRYLASIVVKHQTENFDLVTHLIDIGAGVSAPWNM